MRETYKRASLNIRQVMYTYFKEFINEYKIMHHRCQIKINNTPDEIFDSMIEGINDEIRDLYLEDIDGILPQHAICIKEWCSPLDNFLFQKGSRYMMSESSEYITILDDNLSNMTKGIKHTLDQKTFNKFFIKEI